MAFTCPVCQRVSHNPNDEREGYCGACHAYTGPGTALLKARCSNEVEQPDLTAIRCPGILSFGIGAAQAKCPVCGGWTGIASPGLELI